MKYVKYIIGHNIPHLKNDLSLSYAFHIHEPPVHGES